MNEPCSISLHLQQTTVAVTQESEIVSESVVVNAVPVIADERRNQQKQSALRLVEVGNQIIDNLVLVAWRNHYTSAGRKFLVSKLMKQINYLTKCCLVSYGYITIKPISLWQNFQAIKITTMRIITVKR